MIYLKFSVRQDDYSIQERVICTGHYSVGGDDAGKRVYDDKGRWERVGPGGWLNCFVMSETGRTIDKIEVR